MDIVALLPYAQITLGVLSTIFILLQRTESGLGGAFGGGDTLSDSSKFSRRGSEKVMFFLTATFTILFIISIFVSLFV